MLPCGQSIQPRREVESILLCVAYADIAIADFDRASTEYAK